MKEVIKDNRSTLDLGMDECCSIAESMIEEIHQIALPNRYILTSANERPKPSLKKKLLHQIRAAKKKVMI
jgi:hypothetical protein